MKTIEVDVAIIGAGTAGLSAYRAARLSGARTVLIESGPYGTTCARVGCMPSKLLIAAADAAHALVAAPGFGIHPGTVRIDGAAVMARVRSERDRFVDFVLDGVAQIPSEDKIIGRARFIGASQLQVDDHTSIHAGRIVIATGSSAVVPPEWKQAGERVVTSDAVFDWADLPAAVAVIGSGVIALELGQALHRLGVRVSIFARASSVAHLTDPLVVEAAQRVLAAQLDLRFQTAIVGIANEGDAVALTSRDGAGQERTERFDQALLAIGRSPNVAGLGLDQTGLALDRRGVPIYNRQTMQCGASAKGATIFIAGDADADRPLLPDAAAEGKIAGANAGRYPDVRPGPLRTALAIAFTDPQIATLGASYKQLCLSHPGKFAIGAVSFEDQGRSRVMLQNHGLLRVYGELGSGRFLGAEMIGPRAEHLAHLLAWACQAKLTVAAMLEMPFYHPVVEEGVRTALRDLAGKLRPQALAPQPCPDCTPGT